jgi:hypothetical protein
MRSRSRNAIPAKHFGTLWNSWRSVQIDHHVVASSNNVVDSEMISHDDPSAHNNQIQYPKNPKTKHQYKQQ